MSTSFERGLATRKQVIGADYVEKSLANASDFAAPMQDLVTRYCWDEIWNRPGLPHKTRSLLNLGILTALNRHHEFKVHVRGAITNGATPEEIQEAILQCAIYIGVPAALESFRLAEEVLKELGEI